ncbi:MAG: VanZ family protein [Bacteroidales bacterium]|nr:VanZ family protein [Bacteroidales bacterium]
MIRYVKQQPLSCLIVLAIWVLCMIPVPETPLDDVTLIDKWAHLFMYGALVFVIMFEYARRNKTVVWPRLLIGGLLLPVVMGGLVELAQAYLTFGIRSGDWLDFMANSVGALLGCAAALPVVRHVVKKNNTL